jgi:hypothetical protein
MRTGAVVQDTDRFQREGDRKHSYTPCKLALLKKVSLNKHLLKETQQNITRYTIFWEHISRS